MAKKSKINPNIKRILDEIVEENHQAGNPPFQPIFDKLIPVQPMENPAPGTTPIEYIIKPDNGKL